MDKRYEIKKSPNQVSSALKPTGGGVKGKVQSGGDLRSRPSRKGASKPKR